jgi:hypothetical protein
MQPRSFPCSFVIRSTNLVLLLPPLLGDSYLHFFVLFVWIHCTKSYLFKYNFPYIIILHIIRIHILPTFSNNIANFAYFKYTSNIISCILKISVFCQFFQICEIPLLSTLTGHARCCHFSHQGALTYVDVYSNGRKKTKHFAWSVKVLTMGAKSIVATFFWLPR